MTCSWNNCYLDFALDEKIRSGASIPISPLPLLPEPNTDKSGFAAAWHAYTNTEQIKMTSSVVIMM